jgi:hypothetical protein
VTVDYPQMQAGKYQMMAKYDFNIPEEGGQDVKIKIDMAADRFLLDYMRVKIIDKLEKDFTETLKVSVINSMNLNNLKLPANANGYSMIIEGVFPYNTTEGQMTIDTLSNNETFELKEVTQCEPVEYNDAYHPTKYGIIFKEKIVISPVDHTSASFNIKLLKDGKEMASETDPSHKPKYFRVEVLDNGQPIFS